MNTYKCFWRPGKPAIEVQADTSRAAQREAAKRFKAKKDYEVTVILIDKDGEQVTHRPLF